MSRYTDYDARESRTPERITQIAAHYQIEVDKDENLEQILALAFARRQTAKEIMSLRKEMYGPIVPTTDKEVKTFFHNIKKHHEKTARNLKKRQEETYLERAMFAEMKWFAFLFVKEMKLDLEKKTYDMWLAIKMREYYSFLASFARSNWVEMWEKMRDFYETEVARINLEMENYTNRMWAEAETRLYEHLEAIRALKLEVIALHKKHDEAMENLVENSVRAIGNTALPDGTKVFDHISAADLRSLMQGLHEQRRDLEMQWIELKRREAEFSKEAAAHPTPHTTPMYRRQPSQIMQRLHPERKQAYREFLETKKTCEKELGRWEKQETWMTEGLRSKGVSSEQASKIATISVENAKKTENVDGHKKTAQYLVTANDKIQKKEEIKVQAFMLKERTTEAASVITAEIAGAGHDHTVAKKKSGEMTREQTTLGRKAQKEEQVHSVLAEVSENLTGVSEEKGQERSALEEAMKAEEELKKRERELERRGAAFAKLFGVFQAEVEDFPAPKKQTQAAAVAIDRAHSTLPKARGR